MHQEKKQENAAAKSPMSTEQRGGVSHSTYVTFFYVLCVTVASALNTFKQEQLPTDYILNTQQSTVSGVVVTCL